MQQGANTAGTPSIMLAHRGPGGDDRVYWSIGDQDENNQVSWPRRQSLYDWRSLSGVSVCTMTDPEGKKDDVVFCAFATTHEEGQIVCFRYYRDSNGTYVWSDAEWIGSNMTDRTPHLIVVNGKLRCIHRGNDDYHLFYSERSGSAWEAGSWSNDTRISEGETNCGPGAVVTSDNVLHVLFRDSGRTGEIFNVQPTNATDWWKYSIGGGSTKSTPCALNHLGKTICVKNAGDKDYVYTMSLEKGRYSEQLFVDSSGVFCNQTIRSPDGPTLVQLKNRTGSSYALYAIYRGVGDEAWVYMSRFEERNPFNTSVWTDERRVGEGDETHYCFFEVGAASFNLKS